MLYDLYAVRVNYTGRYAFFHAVSALLLDASALQSAYVKRRVPQRTNGSVAPGRSPRSGGGRAAALFRLWQVIPKGCTPRTLGPGR